jgi:hypothetical protein
MNEERRPNREKSGRGIGAEPLLRAGVASLFRQHHQTGQKHNNPQNGRMSVKHGWFILSYERLVRIREQCKMPETISILPEVVPRHEPVMLKNLV